jgi:hypothetical protein
MVDLILPFARFRPSSQGLADLKAQPDFNALLLEDNCRLIFSETSRQFILEKDGLSIPIVQWLNFPIILYLLSLRQISYSRD